MTHAELMIQEVEVNLGPADEEGNQIVLDSEYAVHDTTTGVDLFSSRQAAEAAEFRDTLRELQYINGHTHIARKLEEMWGGYTDRAELVKAFYMEE